MLKACIFIVSVVCCLAVSMVGGYAADITWKAVNDGIRESDLKSIAAHPDDPDTAYAASDIAVYKTNNGGKEWKEILSFRSTGNSINVIAAAPENPDMLYAGTRDGLYRSDDAGKRWERIFRGVDELENAVLAVAVHPQDPDLIYAGTGSGIFYRGKDARGWTKTSGIPSGVSVPFIAIDSTNPGILYAASDGGLYKSVNSGAGWKKVLAGNLQAEDDTIPYEIETAENSEAVVERKIRCVVIDPVDARVIYTATSAGLLVSDDRGSTWNTAGSMGLVSRDIRHLAVDAADSDGVYAATARGVFRYAKTTGAWDELYKGMTASDIRHLSVAPMDGEGSHVLWAVTNRGVYTSLFNVRTARADSGERPLTAQGPVTEAEDALAVFAHEPSIEETRKAAIIYAEVQPEKIEAWRKAAAYKALLPDLRVSYDRNKDWQTSTYFYSTAKEKYSDDDITYGKDKEWSISATWELGELIWNNDQTSIDSRSRLMVQLRDDVLNEVTRIYFERRRLQVEMLLSPPEDTVEKIETELRLQELTASLDALTGSYFSERMKQGSGVN